MAITVEFVIFSVCTFSCLSLSSVCCSSVSRNNGALNRVSLSTRQDRVPYQDCHLQTIRFQKFEQRYDYESASREKREADSLESCVINHADPYAIKTKLDATAQSFQLDKNSYSVALTWAPNNVMLLLSAQLGTSGGKDYVQLYRSTDGGRHYEPVKDLEPDVRLQSNFQKCTSDENRFIFVAQSFPVSSTETDVFITKDAGYTFHKATLPFELLGSFVFHHTVPDYILARSNDPKRNLYISTDFGTSWKKIASYVKDFKWGRKNEDSNECIFITYTKDVNRENEDGYYANTTVSRSTDLGKSFHTILRCVHGLGIEGKFMFASVLDTHGTRNRTLYVSTDGGKTWDQPQLPSIRHEQFFTVLDGTEGMVFLHVDDPGNTGKGQLYTSDGDGIIYSLSLKDHLYTNDDALTDFYKVQSLRGVYFTSQLMQPDNTLRTMITYNRGGRWQTISEPFKSGCSNDKAACNLNIHHQFSKSQLVPATEPLSSENALGLILVHGSVGETTESDSDVYISVDGGYVWSKALDGQHHYAILDYGGLIVAVPHSPDHTADTLKFSFDEGTTWNCYKFTNKTFYFTGLLNEPGSKTLVVNLWGYEGSGHWSVITIDFRHVLEQKCNNGDFASWIPHNFQTNSCVLGLKETYKRKKDTWCYIGDMTHLATSGSECLCTTVDYECEYGFYHPETSNSNGVLRCVQDPHYTEKICERGHEKLVQSSGYRKIPGDQCEGGYSPGDLTKIKDLAANCSFKDRFSIFPKPSVDKTVEDSTMNNAIIALIVIAVICLAIIMIILFARKLYQVRAGSGRYRYARLSAGEQVAVNLGSEDDEQTCLMSSASSPYSDHEEPGDNFQHKEQDAGGSLSNGPQPSRIPNTYQKADDDSDDELLLQVK